jgi:hypothetical protein
VLPAHLDCLVFAEDLALLEHRVDQGRLACTRKGGEVCVLP